jgi:hypothetical protein
MFPFNRFSTSKNYEDVLRIVALAPGMPQRVTIWKCGTEIRQQTDGSFTARQRDGSEYAVDAGGDCSGKICTVESVTIADIAYVTEHHVNRIHNTVSHVVRFLNGGSLCYSVDAYGRVIDCEFSKLQLTLIRGHVIVGCTDVALLLEPSLDD